MDLHSSPADDAVTITTTVDAAPATAFKIFTAELSASWRRPRSPGRRLLAGTGIRKAPSCKAIRSSAK